MTDDQKKKISRSLVSGAAIVDRLLEAYRVETLGALAEAMGEGVSTVKNWRARDSVPLDACVIASKDTKRTLDWIVNGVEAPSLDRSTRDLEATRKPLKYSQEPFDVHVVEQAELRWIDSAERGQTPRHGTRTGGSAATEAGALLPADSKTVRPLVLSLDANKAGRRKEYEVIPKMLGVASAGPLKEATAEPLKFDRAGDFAMSYEWLSRNLHHTSGDLITVQVHGDSMSPTLLDGDTIIIDRGVQAVEVDGIYVIDLQGNRLVKRLQRKFDETLVIISDNLAYERETVPRGRVREIAVIGRMVWPRVR